MGGVAKPPEAWRCRATPAPISTKASRRIAKRSACPCHPRRSERKHATRRSNDATCPAHEPESGL